MTSLASQNGTVFAPTRITDLIEPLSVIVEGRPSGSGFSLTTAIAFLDNRVRNRPETVPPVLRHYLERRSYGKALAWLRHPDQREIA